MPFLFVFFFCDTIVCILVYLTLTPKVCGAVLILLYSFSCSASCMSTMLSHLSCFCLSYSTVGSLKSILISVIALFTTDWLFFISSRYSLNISCSFSICVSSLFICISILLSRFNIIFTVIFFHVDSLSPPLLFGWWVFIMFLHLQNISLPFHFIQIAVFWVPFLQAGES